jgi:hypothetical protein
MIQKVPEQPTWKARNQGTTENSHTGYCLLLRKVLILSTKRLSWDVTNIVTTTLNNLET